MFKHGSYLESDVEFLLTDISDLNIEKDNETREKLRAEGKHYASMLPIEYQPTEEYFKLYQEFLKIYSKEVSTGVGVLAQRILQKKGENVVIVSLARAGTPIGVLLKRYFRDVLGLDVPHYSVSIIRGYGIDTVAMDYILEKHPDGNIQFVDGWTGKGAIRKELEKTIKENNYDVDDSLAVISDAGHCAEIYYTRKDIIIPSSCLNSTVSGLMSRTVYDKSIIKENEFHGAKYYSEYEDIDVSLGFIEKVEQEFKYVKELIETISKQPYDSELHWKGLQYVESVQKEFGIQSINKIKPSVGEATRVLLRRVPDLLLVRDLNDDNVKHLLLLAKDKNVPVQVDKTMPYACCGIIKEV